MAAIDRAVQSSADRVDACRNGLSANVLVNGQQPFGAPKQSLDFQGSYVLIDALDLSGRDASVRIEEQVPGMLDLVEVLLAIRKAYLVPNDLGLVDSEQACE